MSDQDVKQPPSSGTEEVSAPIKKAPMTNAQRQAKYAKNRKESRQKDAFVYNSKTEPTTPEAKRILEARGLNPHVIEVCYDLALKAAEQTGTTPNRYYFQNGIAKTLESHTQKAPQLLAPIPDEPIVGELSSRPELVCIHDFSIGWREDAFDFGEFLRLRRIFKTDPYEAGLLVGGEDFEECCQKNWAALLPKPNPDTLPPNYTQRQMREWLDSLSDVKDYLILASRNAMKSSFILIWLRSLHLCCPDARALLVSETTKLSAGFIRKYRSFWEVKPNQETMLQKLFPEYCITPGTGSTLEFESPMAHLDLIQASATSTSMQSVVAGGRAEVLLFDDPISNLSCGTEDQRKKSVDLFDLLQKLREVNGSYSITIGTPWFAEEDLYAVLLKRNKADETKSLAFRVDPILTLKRTAQHKLTPTLLPTLTPEDIESFLLPVRMPWRFVKREISANPTFALSQNFCIFPKESDADLKVTFDEADLRAHLRPIGSFESAFSKSVMSLDRAYSVSKYADFSAICAGRIQVKDQQQICVIADVLMDRFRESELVDACVKKIIEHHPTHFVMERDKGWETLIQSIQRKLMLMGVPSPQFQTKPIPAGGQNIRAKAKRIKILELPLMDGRLWFVSSAVWNDPVLEQFIKYDGITVSNSHRKEDAVDAIALLYESYMPRLLSDIPVESTTADEQKKIDREAEEEVQRQNRVRHYEAMFGSNYQPPPKEPEQLQQQPDPRNKIFGGNGLGITRRT